MGLQAALRFRLRCKTPPPPAAAMADAEGDSSDDEGDREANSTARARCGQFVWPCPREYPADAADRKKQKWLIPADLSKERFGLMFKTTCARHGQGPNLEKISVFDEPHKRYDKDTRARERHEHLIFKMRAPFAHLRIQRSVAEQGVYGRFKASAADPLDLRMNSSIEHCSKTVSCWIGNVFPIARPSPKLETNHTRI